MTGNPVDVLSIVDRLNLLALDGEPATGFDPYPTEINEPLIRDVLAYIEMHPEQWNQNSWWLRGMCGTTGCFAGWTVVLGHPAWGLERADEFHASRMDVEYRAARLLGLTAAQAARIFYFTAVGERHPSFVEFCRRVEEVTGVRFKPAPEVIDEP